MCGIPADPTVGLLSCITACSRVFTTMVSTTLSAAGMLAQALANLWALKRCGNPSHYFIDLGLAYSFAAAQPPAVPTTSMWRHSTDTTKKTLSHARMELRTRHCDGSWQLEGHSKTVNFMSLEHQTVFCGVEVPAGGGRPPPLERSGGAPEAILVSEVKTREV